MIRDWKSFVLSGLWNIDLSTPANTTPIEMDISTTMTMLLLSLSDGVYTLPNGAARQYKLIYHELSGTGYRAQITPSRLVGGSVINLYTAKDGVVLMYNGTAWEIVALIGKAYSDASSAAKEEFSSDRFEDVILGAVSMFERKTSSAETQTATISEEMTVVMLDTSSGYAFTSVEFEDEAAANVYKAVYLQKGSTASAKLVSDLFDGFNNIMLYDEGDGVVMRCDGSSWEILELYGGAKKV